MDDAADTIQDVGTVSIFAFAYSYSIGITRIFSGVHFFSSKVDDKLTQTVFHVVMVNEV